MTSSDSIDRATPALPPDAPVVMKQNWHHLLFLHWEAPPAELQALLPPGLDLDTFDGKAYIGLVPFTMSGVRPVLMPALPGLSSFHEVNVRTYVHHRGQNPGVWFFSLDASSALAVAAARVAYHLRYFAAKIEFEVGKGALPEVSFRSHRDDPSGPMPANCEVRYAPADGVISHAVPGTLDHFLVERYCLYSVDQSHRLHRARVHHQPYPLQRATVQALDETLIWAAGVRRSGEAPLRHYAREVNVSIYPLEGVI